MTARTRKFPSGCLPVDVTALPAIVLGEGADVGDIYTTGFAATSFDPLGASSDLGVGKTRIAYDVYTHCGVEWLGLQSMGSGDTAAFVDLWQELGLVGSRPAIDFISRVVLHFGVVESSICPLGPLLGLVYLELTHRAATETCLSRISRRNGGCEFGGSLHRSRPELVLSRWLR